MEQGSGAGQNVDIAQKLKDYENNKELVKDDNPYRQASVTQSAVCSQEDGLDRQL